MIGSIVFYRQELKTALSSFPVFPVTKSLRRKFALFRNIVNLFDVQMGGVNPSWDCWRCRVDCPDPPPPSCLTFLLCGKSAECWGTIQLTVLLSLGFWHAGYHSIIIFIISNFISLLLLTLRRVSWTSFRLSLCQFSDQVPWLPRVVFQLSLEHLWPLLTRSSLLPGYYENHLIWVDLSLMAPLS